MKLISQAARFGAVGLAVNAIGYVIFAIQVAFSVSYQVAMPTAYACTAMIGYVAHRVVSFGSPVSHGIGVFRYAMVQCLGAAVNYFLLGALIRHAGLDPFLSQAICVVSVAVVTFVGCRAWVFGAFSPPNRPEPNTTMNPTKR